MLSRLVIYQDNYSWNGAVEFTLGRWPFKKTNLAPITHAKTPEEVFSWLLREHPDRVIVYDPSAVWQSKPQSITT
jgi:hypothetical protein